MKFLPDWSQQFTPNAFEETFKIDFEGPGFYLSTTDTLLAIPVPPIFPPTHKNVWNKGWPAGTIFHVHVWNCPFNDLIFSASSVPPTRHDSRK